MAYFDKNKGEIILEQDDKEMFKEVSQHFTNNGFKHSEWCMDIIKWLNGELKNENS
ncbi:MAG: hypothetical protein WCO06_01385 [Candidatus Roizmanbacteria bacterium]